MIDVCVALGWVRVGRPYDKFSWTVDSFHVGDEFIAVMDAIEIEDLPRHLEYRCWSTKTEEAFTQVIVPYLGKRLELGI